MAISMTGFGAAEFEWKTWSCRIEIRSVNQRFLDIRCKIPLGLQEIESEIKKQIKFICNRGKIDCSIRLEKSNELDDLHLNLKRAKRYSDLVREFKNLTGIDVTIDAKSLLSTNIIEDKKNDVDPYECKKLIDKTMFKALTNLRQMKAIEGKEMQKDILKRLSICKKILKLIEKRSLSEPEIHRKRLQERLSSLNLETKINFERLEQEIVLFAEKLDISEELLRFRTHLKHMNEIMKQNEIGKKAEFLIQELNREVNTIASKSSHAEISHASVDIKSELEKIREQLQNIE